MVLASSGRPLRVGRARAACACRPSVLALLTLAAGVPFGPAVERLTGLAPAIKWPNDLLVGRRKLAGILAEGVRAGNGGLQAVVLGYGINVQRCRLSARTGSRVTSLETELGRPVDRAALCCGGRCPRSRRRYHDLLEGRSMLSSTRGARGRSAAARGSSGTRRRGSGGRHRRHRRYGRAARADGRRSNASSPAKCVAMHGDSARGGLHAASD